MIFIIYRENGRACTHNINDDDDVHAWLLEFYRQIIEDGVEQEIIQIY